MGALLRRAPLPATAITVLTLLGVACGATPKKPDSPPPLEQSDPCAGGTYPDPVETRERDGSVAPPWDYDPVGCSER
jgi:hypothetical protein